MRKPYKIALYAQLAVINWLIGRCEDQMVRSWLIVERDYLKRVGEPVDRGGRLIDLTEIEKEPE